MLRKLCEKYTSLCDSDVEILMKIKDNMQLMSNLANADLFIDTMVMNSEDAIVLAECKPNKTQSLYDGIVVGQVANIQNEPAVLRTLKTGIPTRDLKATTQENKVVRQSVEPIRNEDGFVIGVLILETDVTEKMKKNRQMERLTKTANQLAETLISVTDEGNRITDHLNDAIVVFDKERNAVYANPYATELYKRLGYKDDIVGMSFDNLALDEGIYDKLLEGGAAAETEKNLGELTLCVKYAVLEHNNDIGVVMLLKDISEIRQKEKALILKSVAMKEIHHRVKNNLQTVASILRLQARRVDDNAIKKAFDENINRILSIALIHEILAKDGMDDVGMKALLIKIKDSTLRYAIPSNKKITATVSGDEIMIDSDRATSIALIVNELLSNALEHAFTEKSEGNIGISIKKGDIYSEVIISDDGQGFAVNNRTDSLGLGIVKVLVKEKLQGHMNITSNQNGTLIEIEFKI